VARFVGENIHGLIDDDEEFLYDEAMANLIEAQEQFEIAKGLLRTGRRYKKSHS